jgi:hypothetical protein
MSEQIVDGRGSGNSMQVDDHGRAYVLANTVSHPAHHASYHKNFFYGHHTTDVTSAGGETICALIQGTNSAIELEMYSVLISADQDVLISVYFDSLYSSGGEAAGIQNSNRTSNKALDVALYQGGAAADLAVDTARQVFVSSFNIPANTPFLYPVDGTVILGNDTSIQFSATVTTDTTVRITTGITPHATGTRL